jgi:hypothetical protein
MILSRIVVCSYKKLPVDMRKGMQILCADGSIVLEVVSTNPSAGTVRARCMNNATLGYPPPPPRPAPSPAIRHIDHTAPKFCFAGGSFVLCPTSQSWHQDGRWYSLVSDFEVPKSTRYCGGK